MNELKIPAFDEDKFSLCFFKRKDSQLEKLELNYFDDEWKNYTLNEQQFKIDISGTEFIYLLDESLNDGITS